MPRPVSLEHAIYNHLLPTKLVLLHLNPIREVKIWQIEPKAARRTAAWLEAQEFARMKSGGGQVNLSYLCLVVVASDPSNHTCYPIL